MNACLHPRVKHQHEMNVAIGRALALVSTVAWVSVAADGAADEVWLLGDEKPHTGEVLEESPSAFIIKFPKEQVQKIQREKPLEIQLWREHRIIWEDTGETIVLTLPKERLASPVAAEPEKTAGLAAALGSVGVQQTNSPAKAVSFTGRVVGKVLSHGDPVEGCKVALVSRGGQSGLIGKLFGGAKSSSDAPPAYQTVTDREGKYALENVALGEYDVFWQPPNEAQWTRKLSEKPNLTVPAGETIHYPDIFVP